MGKLFDVSLVFSSIPELLTKLPITLELAVVSLLIGLGLGLVMAIIKMIKGRERPTLMIQPSTRLNHLWGQMPWGWVILRRTPKGRPMR